MAENQRSVVGLLVVSESEDAAAALVRALEAAGVGVALGLVSGAMALSAALLEEPWDLVAAQDGAPGLPWRDALALVQAADPDLPFLLVAEAPDPEEARAAIEAGAHDVVLREDWRLAPAALSALRRAAERHTLALSAQRLREAEGRYRNMVENAALGIFQCTPWGGLLSANPALLHLLAAPSFEALRAAWREDVFLDPAEWEKLTAEAREQGRVGDREVRARCRDGREVWLSLSVRAVGGGSGEVSLLEGAAEDVTRRKAVEAMIVRAKTEWERTFDAVGEPIAIVGLDGRLRRLNMSLASRLGAHPKAVVGRPCAEVFGPELGLRLRGLAAEPGRAAELHLPALGGDFLVMAAPFAPEGASEGYVLTAHDVTRRKALEAQLRQSQKMEAVGALAGGIAHDFNNILGVIMGYTEMNLDEAPAGSSLERRSQEVLLAGRRARDLIAQILAFSRREEAERKPLRLAPVVKEAARMLRASLPSSVRMELALAAESDTVLANLTQVHQVLMNLCTNAAQAMGAEGGRLRIGLAEVEPPAEAAAGGSWLALTVQDEGPGVPEGIRERIFDPFFTTKRPGEGTGMGLAMAHGIVEAHGGEIRVDSPPEGGARFTVLLPLAGEPAAEACPAEAPAVPGKGRVLVVDDEPALARALAEMLEGLGYSARAEISSEAALAAFAADPGAFDLLLTDLVMPGLSGLRLAAEVRRKRPGLPIVLCSGRADTLTEADLAGLGLGAVVQKPVLKRELAAAMAAALGRAGAGAPGAPGEGA
ncbi:MAG: ATP-binding protein [Thermodesulfobacteriota bacterium]